MIPLARSYLVHPLFVHMNLKKGSVVHLIRTKRVLSYKWITTATVQVYNEGITNGKLYLVNFSEQLNDNINEVKCLSVGSDHALVHTGAKAVLLIPLHQKSVEKNGSVHINTKRQRQYLEEGDMKEDDRSDADEEERHRQNEEAVRRGEAEAAERRRQNEEAVRQGEAEAAERRRQNEEAVRRGEAEWAERRDQNDRKNEDAVRRGEAEWTERRCKNEEAVRRGEAEAAERRHKNEEAVRRGEADERERLRQEEQAKRRGEAETAERLRQEEQAGRRREADEREHLRQEEQAKQAEEREQHRQDVEDDWIDGINIQSRNETHDDGSDEDEIESVDEIESEDEIERVHESGADESESVHESDKDNSVNYDEDDMQKIQSIMNITEIYKQMKGEKRNLHNYTVRLVPKKFGNKYGVGLKAQRNVKAGETVAYYRMRLFRHKTTQNVLRQDPWPAESPLRNKYSITLRTVSGELSNMYGDIAPDSMHPAEYQHNNKEGCRGYYIPYWAYFANEPEKAKGVNVRLDEDHTHNFHDRNRTLLRSQDSVRYKLVAVLFVLFCFVCLATLGVPVVA